MKARALLWAALLLPAYPLLFWSASGCSLIVQDDEPDPEHSAMTCECACNTREDLARMPPVRNDATQDDDGTLRTDDDPLVMSPDTLMALRFINVNIPRNSNITSAVVEFVASESTGTYDITIQGHDSANAGNFGAQDIVSRVRTDEAAQWAGAEDWAEGSIQTTSDLSEVIGALVRRSDWRDGSAIVLVFEASDGERAVRGQTGGNDVRARLLLEFDEQIVARLPICLESPIAASCENEDDEGCEPEDDEETPQDERKAFWDAQCESQVQGIFQDMVGEPACEFLDRDQAATCSCAAVPTSTQAKDEIDFYGDRAPSCEDPDTECVREEIDGTCSNFDPAAFYECLENQLDACDLSPAECDAIVREECSLFASANAVAPPGAPGEICIANDIGQDPDAAAAAVPAEIATTPQTSVAMHIFGRLSVCEVSGESMVSVDGDEPTDDPITQGRLEIIGGPCPGELCGVGFSSRLALNPIRFTRTFGSATFRDLTHSGATVIGAATVGDDIPGVVGLDSLLTVNRGRRGGDRRAIIGTNSQEPVDLVVNWEGGYCSLNGELLTTVDPEVPGSCSENADRECLVDADCVVEEDVDEGPCVLPDGDVEVFVDVAGPLVNQPPTALAGDSRTEECTSPAGATFTLDGSSSFDPDDERVGNDIRLASWFEDGEPGVRIASDLVAEEISLGVGESASYRLLVVDAFAQADEGSTTVTVVDTTPPQIHSVSVDPASLWPANHKMRQVEVSVIASDVCDPTPVCRVVAVESNEPVNGLGDGNTAPDWELTADLAVDLRAERSGTGTGRIYTLSLECADASGNTAMSATMVTVPHDMMAGQ